MPTNSVKVSLLAEVSRRTKRDFAAVGTWAEADPLIWNIASTCKKSPKYLAIVSCGTYIGNCIDIQMTTRRKSMIRMVSNQKPSVSVIIPTLNAEEEIGHLLDLLRTQTCVPDEILVIDSESSDNTINAVNQYPTVRTIAIKQADFDHGGTRDFAIRETHGDIILFLTQDAMPCDDRYIESIAYAVMQDGVACACGRQIARADAPAYEKLTREFNYPCENFVRDASDIARLGIKAYFLSDVCSAYKREAYLAVGGFDRPLITNEDMLIAAKFLHEGYKIAYCAEAAVFHSHTYSLRQEFERNCKIGLVMEQYKDRFGDVNAEKEGLKYVRYVLKKLLSKGALGAAFQFCLLCTAKMLGNRSGRRLERNAKA